MLGGEIIIFFFNDLAKKNDFKDEFKWRCNGSSKNFPPNDPKVSKRYFHVKGPNGVISTEFKKHIWRLIDQDFPILIHYIGDCSFLNSGPHGNAKDKDSVFVPTKPSTLNMLRVVTKSAHKFYKFNNNMASDLKHRQNLKYVINLF